MSLFVDASGWIALFSAADKYHAAASLAFRSLQTTPRRLVTSDYVLDETLTYLRLTFDHPTAVRFGRWVSAAAYVETIWIDDALWQDAWRMFQSYADKRWSFTDCTSFVLMRQHGLYHAFAFDRHFQQAGFQLWPGESSLPA